MRRSRHPGQGSKATAGPGGIGHGIVERGLVLALAHFSTGSRAWNPAVLLNGSRTASGFRDDGKRMRQLSGLWQGNRQAVIPAKGSGDVGVNISDGAE